MKLNPPETAPKDGAGTAIMGDFGTDRIMYAVWNGYEQKWLCAFSQSKCYMPLPKGDFHIEKTYHPHSDLRGWLPLPTIDDEGNVKCASK